MKKYSRTIIFAVLTVITVSIVYVFDYRAGQIQSEKDSSLILSYDPDQINYLQIIKGDEKIGLQKSEVGWSLLEPIQDQADDNNIEDFLKQLADERQIAVVKNSETDLTETELREFGLDKPAVIFNFKNNLGHTRKIAVGSIKNYEGNSYLRIDAESRVLIAGPFWFNQAANRMIYYRAKKLYRGNLASVERIKIRSLRDEFELRKSNGRWEGVKDTHPLDQNKVRELLKSISETKIEEYIFEGEPSVKMVREKGLEESQLVELALLGEDSNWSVKINLHTTDKALYALTERPTFLVKLELTAWETFGNLSLDGLRDRTSALAFNTPDVARIYYKHGTVEKDIELKDGHWRLKAEAGPGVNLENDRISHLVDRIHDLQISEFLGQNESRGAFAGNDMLILKSATDKLLLQLNWGPSFSMKKSGESREYYYARTHLSDDIFAIEKSLIDDLQLDKVSEPPAAEADSGKH